MGDEPLQTQKTLYPLGEAAWNPLQGNDPV
jgi:hypothetical protein